jgi:hypothetical protein
VFATRDRTLAAVAWVDGGVVTAVAGALTRTRSSPSRGPVTAPADPPRCRATPPRRAAADLVAGPAAGPAWWCSGLRKRYGRRVAVEDVSLEVGRGEVVGLLGPNGAGKTTVIKMLLGLVQPDAGEVMLLGRPASDPAARARVGYLPELFRYQPWLSAAEVLALHVRLTGSTCPRASSASAWRSSAWPSAPATASAASRRACSSASGSRSPSSPSPSS